MDSLTENTSTISADLKDKVLHKLEKLNRRAAKLGLSPLVVAFDNERMVKETTESGDPKNYKVIDVTIHGAAPKIAGWEFIASIKATEVGNIIRTVPGIEIDLTPYRDSKIYCDHCQTRRTRNKGYIVRNDEGEFMQVGSSCLRDFLGHNPASILWVFKSIDEFTEDEWENYSSSGPSYFTPREYLAHVAACIRAGGWISRSRAGYGEIATADWALQNMFPFTDAEKQNVIPVTEDHKLEAENAIEWAKGIDATNDFLHNIKVVASLEYICYKEVGIAAAILMAYQKEQSRLIEAERKAKVGENSEFVGNIKDRIKLENLKVEKINYHDGFYGLTYITTLVDEKGNVYTWFASKELEVGKTYSGKGTVKNHTVFNNVKQTVLTRCNLDEV
jgi:uncharacterized protein (DUF2147 family)